MLPAGNVAYMLGKVEAIYKVDSIATDGTDVVVRSLADSGETEGTAFTNMGKGFFVIPQVDGWRVNATLSRKLCKFL